MTVFPRRALLAALMAACLSACGKNDAAQDPLAYVPADSPYVLANRIGTPEAVTASWMNMYGTGMEEMYADMASDPELGEIEGEFGEWMRAAIPELGKMTSVDGMKSVGLKPEARYALFGYGLLPVYRAELGDESKLNEVVARIEGRAGKKLQTRTIDDVTLWQFANDKATVLFGPVNKFLVVTVIPAGADDARVRSQIGLTLPESSMLDANTLEALDKKNGYTGHVSGYIDIVALGKRLSGRNESDNGVIAAFGGDVPAITPECAAELDSVTAHFPRMVFGTTTFDAKHMVVNSVLELESSLAAKMQTLAAPIPGANETDSALFRFAMSANLPEAVRFLSGISDSITTAPYKCEQFQDINTSAAQLKQGLANPGLAMAGSVSAIHLGLTKLELGGENEMPKALSGYLAVGSASPMMLWGLMQTGAPALAKVTLSTNGEVVALPQDAAPMPFPLELKAVMTEKSMGIATADIDNGRFVALSTVPASADGTMLRYGINGSFFTMLADQIPAPPDGSDEKQIKEMERGRKMIRQMGQNMGEMDVRMRLTPAGIEFVQQISLK